MAAPTPTSTDTLPESEEVLESQSFESKKAQQSLPSLVHARRDEFTTSQEIRIKIGTWNVAANKDTDKDLGEWFVGAKGVEGALTGLPEHSELFKEASGTAGAGVTGLREGVVQQEERYAKTAPTTTIPKADLPALPANDEIGIYALGLQELVDVTSATEALRPYTDPAAANRFKKAMAEALPSGYQLVAEQQLIGLLLLIYASPQVYPSIRSVSTTSVGTGLMGYMGNKGAVTARLILGETTRLVFINAHMAAGSTKADLERRNWDAAQILSRTRFDPITDSLGVVQDYGERIGDEDLAFWFGDLNYRLEGIPADDVRHLLQLHTQNGYDSRQPSHDDDEDETASGVKRLELVDNTMPSEPHNTWQSDPASVSKERSDLLTVPQDQRSVSSSNTLDGIDDDHPTTPDPASLQTTISSLMAHDELYQQQKTHKAFADGWREGPITFLPTYKYDLGSVGVFDSSEKKRAPSWCDRILFRTRNDKLLYEKKNKEAEEAKKRDLQMQAQGLDDDAYDESTLFEYDPDVDGEGEDEGEEPEGNVPAVPLDVHTREGFDDSITLEYYVAHHRVLSSDHKPLNAVFRLKYDAIVPELRTKVHQEVVRELDKAENEGRPKLTVVVEGDIDDTSRSSGVDFGKVRYQEPKVTHITLANTGLVSMTFGFVDGLEDELSRTTPKWVLIDVDHNPDSTTSKETGPGDLGKTFTLAPGDVCDVKLTALVDTMPLVRELNEGHSLDDVLVLRVKDGRDHFIGVRALWQATSVGSTIDKLIRLPEGGMRYLQGQIPKRRSRSANRSRSTSKTREGEECPKKWSAPRELFRLTEAIESLVERAIAEQNILKPDLPDQVRAPWHSWPGWPFDKASWTLPEAERAALRIDAFEALDAVRPFDDLLPADLTPLHRLEVLSDTLLIFLRHLQDGVITESMWNHIDASYLSKEAVNAKLTNEDRKARILECLSLSPNHSVCFVFLTAMMSRVAKEVVATVQDMSPEARSSLDIPNPSGFRIRRRASSLDPVTARQQAVNKKFATIFAEVMIRYPAYDKWKFRKAAKEDGYKVIEPFLQTESER